MVIRSSGDFLGPEACSLMMPSTSAPPGAQISRSLRPRFDPTSLGWLLARRQTAYTQNLPAYCAPSFIFASFQEQPELCTLCKSVIFFKGNDIQYTTTSASRKPEKPEAPEALGFSRGVSNGLESNISKTPCLCMYICVCVFLEN